MLKDNRKIAAILAADVVDYSRLMSADEAGTLDALKIRRAIFDRLVSEFEGQEFGSVGDSLMAQFPSAINAVRCAVAVQRAVAAENDSLPRDRHTWLRVGVNLGDIIEQDGTPFGDGVNIAARLQGLATPGGILVSGSVYEHVKNKLAVGFKSLGARQVKNISEPVQCYEVTETVGAPFGKPLGSRFQPLSWRLVAVGFAALLAVASLLVWRTVERTSEPSKSALEQKSIAVLPFVDLSESRDQEYFADGLAEDVRNLLANIPTLKVIGRTSSFQFKGKSADLRAIGTALGAAYVVEGSVRRSGDRVRVTADLIRAQDGVHRWSNTYDRALGDIFKLQDELATGLARALQVEVAADNLHASTDLKSPEAYEFYLRALHAEDLQNAEGFAAAENYLLQALQLDPTFAATYTELAFVYMVQAEIKSAPPSAHEQARRTAAMAIELDPKSARPHAIVAWTHMAHDWDWSAAAVELERALSLTPHDGLSLKCAARLAEVRGDWAEALRHLRAAVSRDPLDPATYIVLGGVYLRAGRRVDAEAAVREVLDISPTYEVAPYALGLTLLALDRPQEALAAVERTTNAGLRTKGLVSVYHALGRQEDSNTALAWLTREHANDDAYGIAQVHAFRGEIDEALLWLDRAYAQKDSNLYRITGDPLLVRLQDEPRFKAFLRKMRVPQ
jgi:TolB-like protein/class 3 adenylate cyclase